MDDALRRPDTVFLCEVPRALGAVTKITTLSRRVVAETESGVTILILAVPSRDTEKLAL
jgi:hypothetical protein